jgi:hypothetical protein
MLIEATTEQARCILRAMRCVATARDTEPLAGADRAALEAAHRYSFRGAGEIDPDTLLPIDPPELAAALDDAQRDHAAQFLTVMALVDGTVDAGKIAAALVYARALGVEAGYVHDLAALGVRRLTYLRADLQRRNMRSITGRDVALDEDAWIQPYRDRPDGALAARFRALGTLAPETLGGAFARFYDAYGFAFPGEPDALNVAFAMPHDATHVLSGYDTTPRGELLVSTFTAGMHPKEPMAGHILPVILSWHLGIELVHLAGATTGKLDPRRFWIAWERGAAVTTDVFAPGWDFFALAETPLETIRARYGVPPLAPEDAAGDAMPPWYRPTA